MVAFQCTATWGDIKSPWSQYFQWLKEHRVFLNPTKLKTDNLVPCGFLLGAHPGYLRRDEAESDHHKCLGITQEELPFQLSSRSVSVSIPNVQTAPYHIQAIVIETSTKYANTLREKFYSLNPTVVRLQSPYIGKYHFIPFLPSREWKLESIYNLARLHTKMISNPRPTLKTCKI